MVQCSDCSDCRHYYGSNKWVSGILPTGGQKILKEISKQGAQVISKELI